MVINGFFLLAGVLIIILGAVAMTKAQQFEDDASIYEYMETRKAAAILVATGAGSVFTAIIGILGAVFRWTNCLKMYTVIVFLVCTLQLAMGIFIFTRDVNTQLEDYWYDPRPEGVPKRQDFQNFLGCCGWENLYDTQTDAWGPTLCPGEYYAMNAPSDYPTCHDATESWITKNVMPLAEAAIVLAVFQFIALAGSCFIVMVTKKDGDDFYTSAYHY